MTNDHFHIIEIPVTNATIYLPRELAYCNRQEYQKMAQLLIMWQSGAITYEEFRVQAVYALLKLTKGNRKLNKIELEVFHANIYEISKCIDTFFDKTPEGDLDIKLNFTNNHTPSVRPLFVKFKGPENRFTNTTFGQYQDALQQYATYLHRNNVESLNNLMAIYYTTSKGYNKASLQKHSNLMRKFVDPALVYGFFLTFSAFQKHITTTKLIIEGQVIDLSIIFKSSSTIKSNIPGLGLKGLGFQLAESAIFGDMAKLRNEPLMEVLLLLYDLRKRELDEKERQKQSQNS